MAPLYVATLTVKRELPKYMSIYLVRNMNQSCYGEISQGRKNGGHEGERRIGREKLYAHLPHLKRRRK